MITLVLGGARSGKSAVAERIAAGAGGPVSYLATGVATDPAMADRIAAHRSGRPGDWTTLECGADLVGAVRAARGVVLVDALGTWLAGIDGFEAPTGALCEALRARQPARTIIVSDEVGMGIHPENDAGRRFRDALGALNQAVAAVADEVYLVVAGRLLPLAGVDGRA